MDKQELKTQIKEKLTEIFKEIFSDYSDEKIKVYYDGITKSFICKCEPEKGFFYDSLEIIANKDGIKLDEYTTYDVDDEGDCSSSYFISFDKMTKLNELIKEFYK